MISFVTGDATRPIAAPGPRVICHVCNDVGAWGAGFVLAVSQRWAAPEAVYRAEERRTLGSVQLVEVEPGLYVANLIAQNGFPRPGYPCALDYAALRQCLRTLGEIMSDASFHMSRIGCGIAGGMWPEVEAIIRCELDGRSVVVYDLPPPSCPRGRPQ